MSNVAGDDSLRDAYREGGLVEVSRRKKKEHASTGFTAATVRAVSARALTFWFRAPAKAFFKSRIDYMGYARFINPRVQAGEAWSWRMLSPVLLFSAVRQHGWGFIPNQFLPPLFANTFVSATLYTVYQQSLGRMHEPSSYSIKRVYPPPPPSASFTAGFVAGSIQSVFAAPLDALQTRFQAQEMVDGKYSNMWQYAWRKTREIGLRGVFAGYSLSLVKDSLGAGVFFATFETIKSQAFYNFVSTWYGDWAKLSEVQKEAISAQRAISGRSEIRPHYLVEPTFLALAGIAASISQAVIQHPLTRVQEVHYNRLAWIDSHEKHGRGKRRKAMKLYSAAYRKSLKHILVLARRNGNGGLIRWLYHDFFWSTLRQAPSTSAGLIAFEIIRRMYGNDDEAVRIPKNGYEIVLI